MARSDKLPYNKLNDYIVCRNCGKPMKQNLLNRNPNAHYCYLCWRSLIRNKPFIKKWYKNPETHKKYFVSIEIKTLIKRNIKQYRRGTNNKYKSKRR